MGLLSRTLDRTKNNGDLLDWACALAIFAWLCWEAGQILFESQSGRAIADLNSKLADRNQLILEQERLIGIRAAVASYLRSLVSDKKHRAAKLRRVRPDGRRESIAKLAASLDPENHMAEVLQSLAVSFRELDQSDDVSRSYQVNFRIGLYVPQDGYLVPWLGLDLKNKTYDPFTSYERHRERFAISNKTNPAAAVRCISERRTIIIPDTCAGGIEFFNIEQNSYLKSLIAHPVFGLQDPWGQSADGSLVVDCDVAGYFREADERIIQFILDEFTSRLLLESYLLPWVTSSQAR